VYRGAFVKKLSSNWFKNFSALSAVNFSFKRKEQKMFMRKTCLTLIIVALIFFAGGYTVTAEENAKININTATVEELSSLKEIGLKKANAIIAYRDENGPFAKVEDIKNVKGIGDKIFESIKDQITVE
jgi:competence protein ComEA